MKHEMHRNPIHRIIETTIELYGLFDYDIPSSMKLEDGFVPSEAIETSHSEIEA